MSEHPELKSARVVFLGAGNMAEALVHGLRKTGVCEPAGITVTDVREDRLQYFRAAFGVAATGDNRVAVAAADVVVLAVKPQVMGSVLREIAASLNKQALVISIAAGVPSRRIEEALGGTPAVVRVMPNTPALVGAGASAMAPGRWAGEEHLRWAGALMRAVGLVVPVDESDLDAVTAVSGSGPAYVFYLAEAMLEAARRLNLDEAKAQALVYATVEGAAKLLKESGVGPAALRERVTSPGGTTAAAVEVLNNRSVFDSVVEAIQAAAARAGELAGEKTGNS
jgi:pyrroline-5-carboxylate reductase